MRQISPHVFVQQEWQGPSLGLIVTAEGTLLVDTPDAPTEAVRWRQMVEEKGPVKYLVNTDGHPDHYFGDYFLPGTLVATTGARDIMANTSKEEVLARVKKIDPDGLRLMGPYQVRVPSVAFWEGVMELELGGQVVRLLHAGGHSPNLIFVYVPQDKVVFAGDNVNWHHKLRFHDADPRKWLASLDTVRTLDADIVVPGHGGQTCGKDYVEFIASIIRQWMDAVKAALKQGWTPEEAVQRIKCPDPYPTSARSPNTEKAVDAEIIHRLYRYFKTGT